MALRLLQREERSVTLKHGRDPKTQRPKERVRLQVGEGANPSHRLALSRTDLVVFSSQDAPGVAKAPFSKSSLVLLRPEMATP